VRRFVKSYSRAALVVCGFVGGGITVVVVTEVTVSVSDLALVNILDVPVTVRTVVPSTAELEAVIESPKTTAPPTGGVTGFGLKLAEMPAGKLGTVKWTGILNPPTEFTVTPTVVGVPPRLTAILVGSSDRVKPCSVVQSVTQMSPANPLKVDGAVRSPQTVIRVPIARDSNC
jgi:hypothetical protein